MKMVAAFTNDSVALKLCATKASPRVASGYIHTRNSAVSDTAEFVSESLAYVHPWEVVPWAAVTTFRQRL